MPPILAIETSCDETAAAVVADGRHILSNVVASQIELHRRYGGVFPEVASRQHVLAINPVVEQAMTAAAIGWNDLAAVAVTEGPGLAGSLLVGVNAAKGIAFLRGLPLIGVNHLEGHVYSNWLDGEVGTSNLGLRTSNFEFPILILIVSGGHTELVLMEDHGCYRRLGGTLDDAAGEAFDKVARLLGLPYPGGPAIQKAAQGGDPQAFQLPKALTNPSEQERRYDFSFSGLKTAVLRLVEIQQAELGDDRWPEGTVEPGMGGRGEGQVEGTALSGEAAKVRLVRDMAASFQAAVADVLVTKALWAAQDFGVAHICVCGGVAANRELRQRLAQAIGEHPQLAFSVPPIWLCTDNAAMIGAAAHYRFQAGLRSGWDLDVSARLPLRSWA